MYIFHQAQYAVYQERVNEALRRSELRRAVKASKYRADAGDAANQPRTTLRSLVTATLGAATRS